jgi:hypothetical protein
MRISIRFIFNDLQIKETSGTLQADLAGDSRNAPKMQPYQKKKNLETKMSKKPPFFSF